MKTNADVTLYNRYIDAGTRSERYQRTYLSGVLWENRKAAEVLAGGGEMAANQAAVYIPRARGAAYLPPADWLALAEKSGFWTLQPGDYLVRGLAVEEISDELDEEASVLFGIGDLKAKYGTVLRIASVDEMDTGSAALAHWQIGAR